MSQHEESNTIKKTKGFISTSGSLGLIPAAKSPSPLSDWALFGRHHNQTDHFSRRISATSFATFTYLCADSNAAPVNYIQVFGRHCRLISKLSWLVKMWSCIKAITISAALITLEPLLISPRSFAQYLKLEDEAAKTCTVKLQATPSGSTHATGICKETAYSFIHFLYPLCAGAWSCPGQLAGYSPDKWPVHHRVTETTIHTHIHTQGQFRAASYPNFHMFGQWEDARAPGEPSQTQGEHANSNTQKDPDPGTKVRPSCCEVTVVLVCICKLILIL